MNSKMISYLAVLFTGVLVFLFITSFPVRALESERLGLEKQKVNPDSYYFPAKRLWEKMRLRFVFSSQKRASYHYHLLEKRVSELDYLTENNSVNEIEKASGRVSYSAGKVVETYEESGLSEGKEQVKTNYKAFGKLFETFRDRYPANSSGWLFVQQNIDTFNILIDRI